MNIISPWYFMIFPPCQVQASGFDQSSLDGENAHKHFHHRHSSKPFQKECQDMLSSHAPNQKKFILFLFFDGITRCPLAIQDGSDTQSLSEVIVVSSLNYSTQHEREEGFPESHEGWEGGRERTDTRRVLIQNGTAWFPLSHIHLVHCIHAQKVDMLSSHAPNQKKLILFLFFDGITRCPLAIQDGSDTQSLSEVIVVSSLNYSTQHEREEGFP